MSSTMLDPVSEAQWRGYRATLQALADGSGRDGAGGRSAEIAQDCLRGVDDLLCDQQVTAEARLRQRVGRALCALGHPELWPALYALTDDDPAGVEPGDAEDFLDWETGVPVPDPPPGWPERWAPPPAGELVKGVELGARVALAVRILGEGYCPDGVLGYELGEPDGPDAELTGEATAAWRAALDRAAALPPAMLLEALASFRYLQQATAAERPVAAPQRAEAGRNGTAA